MGNVGHIPTQGKEWSFHVKVLIILDIKIIQIDAYSQKHSTSYFGKTLATYSLQYVSIFNHKAPTTFYD